MKKNAVVHFEIYADDPDKLAKFYTTLFDWDIQPAPGMDYRMVQTVETDAKHVPTQAGINGGLLKRPAGYNVSAPVNYINVESLDAAVKHAQELGAKVTKGRSAVPGMGWFAMLIDPQGNHFAMWEADQEAK